MTSPTCGGTQALTRRGQVLAATEQLSPYAATLLSTWGPRPFGAYLGHVADTVAMPWSPTQAHRLFWAQATDETDDDPWVRTDPEDCRDGWDRQVRQRLVCHTGEHLQFAGNSVSIGNLLAAYLFARACGHDYAILSPTSRNALRGGPRLGPGYLNASGTWNVLGLRASALRHDNVVGHRRPSTFRFTPQDEPALANRLTIPAIRAAMPELFAHTFASASQAFRASYHLLWRRLGFSRDVGLVVLDSDFVGRLAGRHLGQPSTTLHALAADTALTGQLLARRSELAAGSPFLSHSTDLYWAVRAGRLRPLRHSGEHLVEADGTSVVRCEPTALAGALASGTITPDLSVDYLLGAIAPDALVTGGISQLEYFPLLQRLFAPVAPPEASRQRAESSGRGSTVFMHGLVDLPTPVPELLSTAGAGLHVAESLLDVPLDQVSGDLNAHRYLTGLASASTQHDPGVNQ